jgi:hypothetical protein
VIKSPKLTPGRYFLTVRLFGPGGIALGESIDACTISSKSYFGGAEIFDRLISAIIPEFEISLVELDHKE